MSINVSYAQKAGERVKGERERLGLSQAALAPKLGISRATQVNYETGKRSPDGGYLHAFGELGADIGYVLFGERSNPNNMFRLASTRVLPQVALYAQFEAGALFGILDIAAEDEANRWGKSTATPLVDEKNLDDLVSAMFEDGKLLNKVFLSVQTALHELDARLPALKLAHVVLTLYSTFRERNKFDKRTVETAVKVAL